MLKRTSLLAAMAIATVIVLPASSQASDCLFLDRGKETRVAASVDSTGRMFTRMSDSVVRTGDRLFGWMTFCKRSRHH
jgi:hypothetical protein